MTLSRAERSARHALGISTIWDADDRRAITAHHRSIFRRIKAEHGVSRGAGNTLTAIPGFTASVQRLYDQGYGFTDIGAFFGVSNERARQWFDEYSELRAYRDDARAMPRLWDRRRMMYVAADAKALAKAHARRMEARARQRVEEAKAGHVAALRRIAKESGEAPIAKDARVIAVIGRPGDYVERWGYPDVSIAAACDALWRAAGLDPRPKRTPRKLVADEEK